MEKIFYKHDVEPDTSWLNKEYRIQLNVTGSCPLNCDFCYIKKNHSDRFLKLDSIKHLWKNLRKQSKVYGLKYVVTITGGDIFFHPEISQILAFLTNEKTVIQIEPLINSFWKEENKLLLDTFKEKIFSVQFNSDVVTESDLEFSSDKKWKSAIKVALYNGEYKTDIKKIKKLLSKFDNLFVATDLIIPQKDSPQNSLQDTFSQKEDLIKLVANLEKELGDRLKITSTTVKRLRGENVFFCPVPFGGFCVMPNEEIISCARYPHLKSGFNIKNFDLIEYISKYGKLCSNFCLFENKYFCDFWDKSENPANFKRSQNIK